MSNEENYSAENAEESQQEENNAGSQQENSNDAGDDKGANSEKQSSESSVDTDEVIKGWGEDRQKLAEKDKEIFQLKKQLADKSTDDDEDDDDLSMDERVERKIQQKEEEKKKLAEIDKKAAEREISYQEKTDPFFKRNKREILQIAVDAKLNIAQAKAELKARRAEAKGKIDKVVDKKKKEASQSATKNNSSRGNVGKKGYDPEVDGKKSISDLYNESL